MLHQARFKERDTGLVHALLSWIFFAPIPRFTTLLLNRSDRCAFFVANGRLYFIKYDQEERTTTMNQVTNCPQHLNSNSIDVRATSSLTTGHPSPHSSLMISIYNNLFNQLVGFVLSSVTSTNQRVH